MPDKEEGDDKKSTKDVVNKKQKQMMGEEGYDIARDEGRVSPSKDKKDATTMPVSDEVKKTQKKNKGPSALERVKADIEKKYGKGAIMKVKKESTELLEMGKKFGPGGDPIKKKGFIDKSLNKLKVNIPVKKIDTDVKTEETKSFNLTKVAEAFGGYIVEAIDDKGNITPEPGEIEKSKKILKKFVNKQKRIEKKNIKTNTQKGDKLLQDINQRKSADLTRADAINRSMGTSGSTEGAGGANTGTTPPKTQPKSKVNNKPVGKGNVPFETGTYTKSKKPPKKRNLFPRSVSKNTPEVKRVQAGIDIKNPTYRSSVTGKKLPLSKKNVRAAVQGGVKSPVGMGKKIVKAFPQQSQVTKKIATQLTKGGLQKTGQLGKIAGKGLARKTIGRAGAKFAAKQIPGLGTVISGGEAIARFASGDLVGGALSAAEMIPGIGFAAGLANVGRDIGTAKRVVKAFRKSKQIRRGIAGYQRSGTAKSIRKMQRTAKKNPLATVAGAGGVTAIGANVGGNKGGLPRIPKPKLDQGVVGRRTAG